MSASNLAGSSPQGFGQPEPVKKCEDLIFDVGLHNGEDSDFYLRKGFRVVAFEANPDLCQRCRLRFEKYLDSGQLVLVEGAILADPGSVGETVRFYKNNELSVWGTVLPEWADRNSRLGTSSATIEVKTVDFAQIIRKFGIPHYMKIDIEGCDMVCVRALKQFESKPDFISIESDKARFSNIQHEIDALVDLGYDLFKPIEQSTIPALQSPPTPPREGQFAPHVFPEGSSGLFGFELEGRWLTVSQILMRYRLIRLGYFLLGDDGIMKNWRFPGAKRLQWIVAGILTRFTKGSVPGWYDTHARHRIVSDLAAEKMS